MAATDFVVAFREFRPVNRKPYFRLVSCSAHGVIILIDHSRPWRTLAFSRRVAARC